MANNNNEIKVLVTGASGYVGIYVVKLLLEEGFMVRGTVRDLKNDKKVNPIRKLCPDSKKEQLELVEVDLLDPLSKWLDVVEGCQYVIHVASPVILMDTKEMEKHIDIAVKGTLVVLQACSEVAGVKRVVVTSSIGAVCPGCPGGFYDELDWNNPDEPGLLPYYRSKTLAEKAAWEFVQNNQKGTQNSFELTTLCPSIISGPVLSGIPSETTILAKDLLTYRSPAVIRSSISLVDVRDVAEVHVKAMTSPEVAGKRVMVNAESITMDAFAQLFNKEFGPKGYKVPKVVLPDFVVKFVALFSSEAKIAVPMLNNEVPTTFDTTLMEKLLEHRAPRSIRESLVDMAYSMIEMGIIPKTKLYIDCNVRKQTT